MPGPRRDGKLPTWAALLVLILLLVAIAAVIPIFGQPELFKDLFLGLVQLGPMMVIALAIGLLLHRRESEWSLIAVLFAASALVILIHAGVYDVVGLKANGTDVDADFSKALYFSIVTFTTLGYGDFQPHDNLRLFAAVQAIFGYLFLGLVVGLASAMMLKREIEGDETKPNTNDTECCCKTKCNGGKAAAAPAKNGLEAEAPVALEDDASDDDNGDDDKTDAQGPLKA